MPRLEVMNSAPITPKASRSASSRVTEFAKILTGRHGEQLDTRIIAVDAADLISKVTDAVNEELAAWRNWPLDRICPV